MFRGSSFHIIDNKGRLIIPARFRQFIKSEEGDGVMISRMDSCLVAYPFKEWRSLENRILSLAETSENMRRFRRVFIGGAFECSCDRQDRILIPQSLRQYADLDKRKLCWWGSSNILKSGPAKSGSGKTLNWKKTLKRRRSETKLPN